MTAMLDIEDLVKRFGSLTAVDGVTFSVGRGEVLGFLGPNGAGKSTTMKIITGFLRADAGRVRVCGLDVETAPLETKAKIGYLPEGAPLYGDMTPAQFLRFVAEVRGLRGKDARSALDRAVAELALKGVLEQPIETLSKGFKRRVGLAQAIIADPEILILDEPTDGLDPNQKHDVRGLIQRMAADKAIVISTHLLEEVEAVCSRAIIIDKGRIVADGTPDALLARSAYHNAVTVTIRGIRPEQIEDRLSPLSCVAAIERVTRADGAGRVRVLAKDARPILGEVAGEIEAAGWTPEQIFAEAGRLDDVFRRITSADTGPEEQRAS